MILVGFVVPVCDHRSFRDGLATLTGVFKVVAVGGVDGVGGRESLVAPEHHPGVIAFCDCSESREHDFPELSDVGRVLFSETAHIDFVQPEVEGLRFEDRGDFVPKLSDQLARLGLAGIDCVRDFRIVGEIEVGASGEEPLHVTEALDERNGLDTLLFVPAEQFDKVALLHRHVVTDFGKRLPLGALALENDLVHAEREQDIFPKALLEHGSLGTDEKVGTAKVGAGFVFDGSGRDDDLAVTDECHLREPIDRVAEAGFTFTVHADAVWTDDKTIATFSLFEVAHSSIDWDLLGGWILGELEPLFELFDEEIKELGATGGEIPEPGDRGGVLPVDQGVLGLGDQSRLLFDWEEGVFEDWYCFCRDRWFGISRWYIKFELVVDLGGGAFLDGNSGESVPDEGLLVGPVLVVATGVKACRGELSGEVELHCF